MGRANITVVRAAGSAIETTPEGGAVTLLARLEREPQPGATIVFAAASSDPRAANAQPGPALLAFDAANWDAGTPVVISGVPYATPSSGMGGGANGPAPGGNGGYGGERYAETTRQSAEERTGRWPRDLDDDAVGGAATAAFNAPREYTIDFTLVWTDDPFYRAATPRRAGAGLLAAAEGLGTGGSLGALPFASFAMTHAAALNATRNVTLIWADADTVPTASDDDSDDRRRRLQERRRETRGLSVASNIDDYYSEGYYDDDADYEAAYPAFITQTGGEATLLARLSHPPAVGAAVVLAVSATFRERVPAYTCVGEDDDDSDEARRGRRRRRRATTRMASSDFDTDDAALVAVAANSEGFIRSNIDRVLTEGDDDNADDDFDDADFDDDGSYSYGARDAQAGNQSGCVVATQPSARAAVVLWPSVVVFTSEDWDVAQPIRLRGLNDGSGKTQHNATADVTLTRIGSSTGDLAYDALLPPVTRIAIKRRQTPPWKLLVSIASGSIVATNEAGNTVTLVARLSAPPPLGIVVAFGVSTDDPTEAVVVQPVDLTFGNHNWDLNATITVEGVDDNVIDGDVLYNVEFYPLRPAPHGTDRDAAVSAEDAWSGALGVSVPLLNRDTVKNRVGVALVSAKDEGGGPCNSMLQRNGSSCELRWALCYPDATAGECSLALTYQQLFEAGVTAVYVDVWLEHHSTPTPVDTAHTAAHFDLQVANFSGVGNNRAFANPHDEPEDDGYFPTTLEVRHSSAGYPTARFPDIARVIVTDDDNEYEQDGAYSSRVTLRARDDGVVRGDHNMTVRWGAYLYEGSSRFPTDDYYLPVEKYYHATPSLPTSLGGDLSSDAVAYQNTESFNITLREVDTAGFGVLGCPSCRTSEKGTFCELRVVLTAIPQHSVLFDATIRPTVDSLNNYKTRYEAEILNEDEDGYVYTREYTITPENWKDGVVVTIKGVDDSLYEVREYTNGYVPYNITIHDHYSADAEWAEIASASCLAYNVDDETGGFIVTQNGITPKSTTSGKIVTSVDESGSFGVAQIEMNEPPSSVVWVPVYVSYGLVNLTGPDMRPCPFAALASSTASADAKSGSWSGDAWENVSSTSLCLRFRAHASGKQKAVVYSGVDDGGAFGHVDSGGYTSFQIDFGPSWSDDDLFAHLHDSVRGTVIDNDIMKQSLRKCNTTERANHTAIGASVEAVSHSHSCIFEIGYDAAYFNGSHDTDLESSAVEFAVVVTSESDEGVFALAVSESSRGATTRSGVGLGEPLVRVNNSYGERGWRGDSLSRYIHGNLSTTKSATFLGGGLVTVIVNGTDDDVDDGDIGYTMTLEVNAAGSPCHV